MGAKKEVSTTSSRFGAKGWNVIVLVGMMLLLCSGTTNDGLNISVAGIAAKNGWDQAILLSYSSYATIVSVILNLFLAKLCDVIDSRLIATVSMVLAGICYIWYGSVTAPWQFAVAFCLVSTFVCAAAWSAGGVYMAMWFPTRKGLAMGWATMGNNLATAAYVPLFNILTASLGISKATLVFGIVIMLVAIWAFFTKAKPEEAGATPDNVRMDKDEIESYRTEVNSFVSPWTLKKLLVTKEFWLVALCLGCTFLATVGVISQLVTRLVSGFGMTQNFAVTCMSICAVVGIVGSYIWGIVDQKIGTKKAVVIYLIWYAVAIVFNIIPGGNATLWISIIMIGAAIGGNANWPVSLTSSVFGYKNFSRVYPYVYFIMSIMRAIAFSVLAFSLQLTGSLVGAYMVFIGVLIVGALCAVLVNDKKYADGITTK